MSLVTSFKRLAVAAAAIAAFGAAAATAQATPTATTYDSSSLTTQKSLFGRGSTAFVTVSGLDTTVAHWAVEWKYPGGSLACGNVKGAGNGANAGSDLPAATTGTLPSGSPAYLQFPPSPLGTNWNLDANYDEFPTGFTTCPGFNGSNDGQWSVTLTPVTNVANGHLDTAHAVTVPVFTVDASRPAVTITSPADGSAVSPSITTFTGAAGTATGDDNHVTVSLFDSNGDPVGSPQTVTASGGTWSASAPSLGSGAYTLEATQTDSAGNTGTAISTFAVDGTAPGVSITVPSDNAALTTGSPTFQGAAGTVDGASPDSANVTLRIYQGGTQVDSRTVTRSGGGWQATPTSTLPDGSYTAQAEQSDAAGNLGKSAVIHFSIDTHAPVVTLDQPADGSLGTDATPTFSGTDGNSPGDQDVHVKIWTGTNTGVSPARSFTITPSGTSWSGDLANADALADGDYTVRAEQSDAAGNSGASAYHHFSVDTTAPTSSATGGSPGSSDGSAFNVTYTASDSGPAGLKRVELWARTPSSGGVFQKVDSDVGAAIDQSFSYTPTAGDGTYAFYTVAVDNAGNVEAAPAGSSGDTLTVVDTGKPSSSAGALPAATNAGSIGIDYSAQDNNGGVGLDHVELWAKHSGGAYQHIADDPAPSQTNEHFTYTPSGDDTYCFYTIAVDQVGNTESAPASSNGDTCTTVDTAAPAPVLTQPADPTGDSTPALHGTAGAQLADATHAADASAVTVRIWSGSSVGSAAAADRTFAAVPVDGSGNWTLHDADFGSGSTAPLGDGTWTAQVTQSDAAGNSGQSVARTFKVDTGMPAPTLVQPADPTGDSTPVLHGTAGTQAADASHSADAGTVTVRLSSGAATRTFTGVVVDGAGNWSLQDSDFGSGQTAPLSDGTWTAQVEQSDGAGNLGQSGPRTFKIDTAAPAPTLAQPADPGNDSTPALHGTAGTQAADVSHSADAGTVTVRLSSGGATRTFTGVPVDGSGTWTLHDTDFVGGSTAPLSDGTWTAQVEQSDGAGNLGQSAPRTFKVDGSAPAPTLVQPADPTGDSTPALHGTAGTQAADGSDSADAATVTVRLSSGGATRTFSGVPVDGLGNWTLHDSDFVSGSTAPLTDGTWTAQVEQSDGAGNLGQDSKTFKVDTAAPAPTLVQPADALNAGTPALGGTAGTQGSDASHSADDSTVTVRIWSGTTAGSPGSADRVFSGVAADGSGNWTLHDSDFAAGQTAPLTDGAWTAQVEQSDGAGNLGRSSARTFKVDGQPPAPTLAQPADPTGDSTPALNGTAGTQAGDATHSADDSTVTVRIWSGSSAGSPGSADRVFSGVAVDGSGNWTLQNSDFGSGQTAPLGDGTWTARAEQSDGAGNLGESATRTFKVDTTAPSISSSNDNQTYTEGASVTADYSCADEAGGSGLASCTGDVGVGQQLDTGSLGAHSFSVTAQDKAGNVGHRTVNYTVQAKPVPPPTPAPSPGGDKTPPQLSFSGSPSSEKLGSTLTLLFACSEDCSYSGSATIALPGSARVHRLGPVTGRLQAGTRLILRLKLDARTRLAVKRTLARHKKVSAKVTLAVVDASGNRTLVTRTIKLKAR